MTLHQTHPDGTASIDPPAVMLTEALIEALLAESDWRLRAQLAAEAIANISAAVADSFITEGL